MRRSPRRRLAAAGVGGKGGEERCHWHHWRRRVQVESLLTQPGPGTPLASGLAGCRRGSTRNPALPWPRRPSRCADGRSSPVRIPVASDPCGREARQMLIGRSVASRSVVAGERWRDLSSRLRGGERWWGRGRRRPTAGR